MKRLLLLGAGHAQLSVLAALAAQPLPGTQALLVTPHPRQIYSGMVPGLLAGRYAIDDCAIPIAPLAEAAGVHLRLGSAVALDAAARSVMLADGESVGYDVLSIDTGATQRREAIEGAQEHALFVRPIETFLALWKRTCEWAGERPLAIVVVGGGAAGVELALAMRRTPQGRGSVTLVAESDVPTGYGPRVQRLAQRALRRAGVQVLRGRCTSIESRHVVLGRMRVASDVAVIATGVDAAAWLGGSGLALDAQGFLRVGPTLQCVNHPEVFGAGDVIVRDDAPHPRSGVYAVRAGPTLAANLRAFIAGGVLASYRPQARSLNLLALGDGRAIGSWGPWSTQGWLMGWWKERIDRDFIARYAGAPQPPKK
jgi:pyridine nucleotide-disulfide oxidoreductase family protein